jgi:hypothetical protein
MALTRIGSVGLSTGIDINAGVGTFTGNLTVGGVLTYEDVTNVDSIGIITARSNILVGSGITLSPDGDGFYTGVVTATTFDGALAASNLTGALPAISGANLTGMAAGGAFVKGVIGVTTLTPVGIETSTVTRKDLIGPAGNTSTGAGSSFHGAYMGDGFLSFNTEFSSSSGYYISTFTNALVAGPMQLGSTLTIDGNFTIV